MALFMYMSQVYEPYPSSHPQQEQARYAERKSQPPRFSALPQGSDVRDRAKSAPITVRYQKVCYGC